MIHREKKIIILTDIKYERKRGMNTNIGKFTYINNDKSYRFGRERKHDLI